MIEPVKQFADAMNAKLAEKSRGNDNYGPRSIFYGWRENCDVAHLMKRLREELAELRSASTPDEIAAECVDVANFAMMIWDRQPKPAARELAAAHEGA